MGHYGLESGSKRARLQDRPAPVKGQRLEASCRFSGMGDLYHGYPSRILSTEAQAATRTLLIEALAGYPHPAINRAKPATRTRVINAGRPIPAPVSLMRQPATRTSYIINEAAGYPHLLPMTAQAGYPHLLTITAQAGYPHPLPFNAVMALNDPFSP